MAETEFKRTVDRLVSLNDDNLAEEVKKNGDVQWCLGELQDILDATDGISAERLIEFAKADKEGCALLLPCKIGSTVYAPVGRGGRIYPCKAHICSAPLYHGEIVMEIRPMGNYETFYAKQEDFGEKVFRTYEEAKQTLNVDE